MLSLLSLSLMCAAVAYVYAEVLTNPGEVLHWWYRFMYKLCIKVKVKNGREARKEHWLFKPLIGCGKCVAGQMGLWVYLYDTYANGFQIGHMVFVISGAILMFLIIKKILIKL